MSVEQFLAILKGKECEIQHLPPARHRGEDALGHHLRRKLKIAAIAHHGDRPGDRRHEKHHRGTISPGAGDQRQPPNTTGEGRRLGTLPRPPDAGRKRNVLVRHRGFAVGPCGYAYR